MHRFEWVSTVPGGWSLQHVGDCFEFTEHHIYIILCTSSFDAQFFLMLQAPFHALLKLKTQISDVLGSVQASSCEATLGCGSCAVSWRHLGLGACPPCTALSTH